MWWFIRSSVDSKTRHTAGFVIIYELRRLGRNIIIVVWQQQHEYAYNTIYTRGKEKKKKSDRAEYVQIGG